jgi:hypothetical protein
MTMHLICEERSHTYINLNLVSKEPKGVLWLSCVASEKVVELWMVEKLLLVVGREKDESRLVEQLWLLENLMSTGPTCQPSNTYFSFLSLHVYSSSAPARGT